MTDPAKSIFGYYDDPTQKTPVYDPGPDALCPICMKALNYPEIPVRTVSLMALDHPKRSYFYRMHLDCAESASDEQVTEIEGSLIDGPDCQHDHRP